MEQFFETNVCDNSSFLFNRFRLAKAIAKVWQICIVLLCSRSWTLMNVIFTFASAAIYSSLRFRLQYDTTQILYTNKSHHPARDSSLYSLRLVIKLVLGWYYLKSLASWYNLWGWYCLSSWETGRVLAPEFDTRHMPIHHTQHWFKPTIDKIRNVPLGYHRNELIVHSNNGWTFHKCENKWKLHLLCFVVAALQVDSIKSDKVYIWSVYGKQKNSDSGVFLGIHLI